MSSAELATQLVFASAGPFITSLWIGGDWGLTCAIFLIGQYLIRLPVFAVDTGLAWPVFNDLDAFWNYTMIGFLIVGSALLGTFARLVLMIPNIVHIRKIFYTEDDRDQHKFRVPSTGTIIFMLLLAILAIAGTLIFHDLLIVEPGLELVAIIATPAIIAFVYLIAYFIISFGCNNGEGVALWGYDREEFEELNRVDDHRPVNFRVMRRSFLAVAAHHIVITLAVDLAFFFSNDFLTTFIVAAAAIGGLFLVDLILYAFWLRSINDFAPEYSRWVDELIQGAINNDDLNLNGVDDDEEFNGFDDFNNKAIPMTRLSGAMPKKAASSMKTRKINNIFGATAAKRL